MGVKCILADQIGGGKASKIEIPVPTQSGTLTYNKNPQSPEWENYDPAKMSKSGNEKETNAGNYQTLFTCLDNYIFPDNQPQAFSSWKIDKANTTLPTQSGSLTYNGGSQTPEWNGNEPGMFTLGGEQSAIAAGTHKTQFTPTSNYQWEDNQGNEMREAEWTIAKAQGSITATPTEVALDSDHLSVDVTLDKTGDGTITVENDGTEICETEVQSNKVVVKAKEKIIPAKKAGELKVGDIVTLNVDDEPTEFLVVHQGNPDQELYDESCNGTWLLMKDCWEQKQWHSSNANDYENSTIHTYLNTDFLGKFDQNIQKAIVQAKIPYRPSSSTSSTVNSGANGLSCKIFLLSGYEVGWTKTDNQYFPEDGAKLEYFIAGIDSDANNKRIANLKGSSAVIWWLRSPDLNGSDNAWLVLSDGDYSRNNCSRTYGVRPALILPSDFELVPSTTEYTSGTAHLDIKMAEGDNYLGAQAEQVTVNAEFMPPKKELEEQTWEEISKVAKAGKAAEYWNIGDIKSIQFNNKEYYVQIIGFDHDDVADAEAYGRDKAGITFQFGVANDKTKNGMYETTYKMNGSDTNSGGWPGSAMCKNTMPLMKGYLPADLQSVIVKVKKLTSKGDQSNDIETTEDELWLLSEVEIFGTTDYSVVGEGTQYEFYQSGNSKVRYESGSAYEWWERSPYSGNSALFCYVNNYGYAYWHGASYSNGVSFGFSL